MKTKDFSKRKDAVEFAKAHSGYIQEFVDENINWTFTVFYK